MGTKIEAIIETEHLVKNYGNATVVNQVNLHVPRGKIYGLLGRNGAGKTTIMKMMLKMISPTGGTIRLFGEDTQRSPGKIYPRVGSIIETPGFYENLTAYENLQLLQRLRGQNRKNDVIEALGVVGLERETKKPFANYSLGMKQRLGIAAAIIHKPELLILDEPINGLDPIGISEIRLFLSLLRRNAGTTILISSHVLGEIEQLADIIGVMHEGCLVEEVDMTELHKRNRKYIEVEVSNVDSAIQLLTDKHKISDYKVDNKSIHIYECLQKCGDINTTFVSNGITVTKLSSKEDTLEEYFSNLIGGGGIA